MKCRCGEVDKDLCPCEYFEEGDPWTWNGEPFDPDEVEWEDDNDHEWGEYDGSEEEHSLEES